MSTVPAQVRHIVIGPDGHPLRWTSANTANGARAALLKSLPGLWGYAVAQGYSVRRVGA